MKKVLLAACLLMLGLCGAAMAAGQPEIVLTTAPAYGSYENFAGFVRNCSDTTQYRVTLFLQLTTGGEAWVKPTYDDPSVPLGANGNFTLDYTTGGSDHQAVVLHLLLIPANYVPHSGLAAAQAAAVDEVVVTRTTAGAVTVSPDRFNAGRRFNYTPNRKKLLMDVGFYTDGSQPGDGLSQALITKQLDAIKPYADGVRFYAASGELYPAYKLAHDRGFIILGTAWLSGNAASDKTELDALIEHCNKGYVSVAIVGNETLLNNTLTEAKLIEYINYVRANLHDTTIPVTTSETLAAFDSPRLIEACDIICPNVYAYFAGTERSAAPQYFINAIQQLRAKCGRKQIVVAESGFPTAGERNSGAWPDEQMAADHFEALWAWSVRTGTPLLVFEAMDEPWKASASGREAERHFGLMTLDGKLKPAYAQTGFFQSAQKGLTPKIVSFASDEGRDPAWARGTGAGNRVTLPGCLYNAPGGMDFKGWMVNGSLRQPGEVVTFGADATVHAVWIAQMPYVMRIKSLTSNGVYVYIGHNSGERGNAIVASYASDGTMLDYAIERGITDSSAYTTYRLSTAQAVCVRAFVVASDGTPLARPSVFAKTGSGGTSNARRWHLSIDVPANHEYLLLAVAGDVERPNLADQRVLWIGQVLSTGANIALDAIRVPNTEDATLFLIDDTGAVVRRFLCASTKAATLPAKLTGIEAEAFTKSGIRHVIVPEGCASIGAKAFAGDAPLLIELPASLANIAEDALGKNASVIAPAGSRALEWARARQLLWAEAD